MALKSSGKAAADRVRKPAKRPAKASAPKRARVKPIPDKYPQISAYLRVCGAQEALQYYADVFGAKVRLQMDMPDRRIGHAEVQVGRGFFMLSDEFPENGIVGPATIGQTSVTLQIYVKDVDATAARGVAAGGRLVRPPQDEFYGDRTATLEDPFGHVWMIQTHIEDVSPAEMKKRLKLMFSES